MVEERTGIRVMYFDGSPKGWTCWMYSTDTEPRIQPIKSLQLMLLNLPEDFITETTNQRAEYLALINALYGVDNYSPHLLCGDCENVILQMEGINKCRDKNMRKLKDIADKLISSRGLDVSFEHVSREDNIAGIHLEKWLESRR